MIRCVAAALGALLLVSLPVAAGAPEQSSVEPFEFTDAVGDVTRAWEPYSGELADTNDIVRAGVREDGSELAFELQLRDLSGLPGPSFECEFHAQYALTLQTLSDHDGYSMRATYRACPHGVVLGPWSFQIHDRHDDEWTAVDGHIEESTIHWTLPMTDIDVGDGDRLEHWSVSAWNSYADGEQSNDDAAGIGWYVVGTGPFYGMSDADAFVIGGDGPFVFTDEAGDVTSGGESASGSGPDTTDILSVRLVESDEYLVFALELRDLYGLQFELDEPGFHAQYAVSFVARDGHEGYSTRAAYGGEQYTNDPAGAWRFNLHDQQADAWPDAIAHVNGSVILWTIPRADVDVDAGDRLRNWTVNTWNSYDERDQYGDYAMTDAIYEVGEAPANESHEAAESLEEDVGQEPVEIPAASVAFLAGAVVVALACTRRS